MTIRPKNVLILYWVFTLLVVSPCFGSFDPDLEEAGQWRAAYRAALSTSIDKTFSSDGLTQAEWDAAFHARPVHPTVTQVECPDLSGIYQCHTINSVTPKSFDLQIDFQYKYVDENHINDDPSFVADVFSDFSDDEDINAMETDALQFDQSPNMVHPKLTRRFEARFYSDHPEMAIAFAGLKQYSVQYAASTSCFKIHKQGQSPYFSFFSPRPSSNAKHSDEYFHVDFDPDEPSILKLNTTNSMIRNFYQWGFFPQKPSDDGAANPLMCRKLPVRVWGTSSNKWAVGSNLDYPRKVGVSSNFDAEKLSTLTQKDVLSYSNCKNLTLSEITDQLSNWSFYPGSATHRSISSHLLEHIDDGDVKVIPICDQQRRLVSVGAIRKSFYVDALVASPFLSIKGAGRAVLLEIMRRCMAVEECRHISLSPIDSAVGFYFKMGMSYAPDEAKFMLEKDNVLMAFPEFERALIKPPQFI